MQGRRPALRPAVQPLDVFIRESEADGLGEEGARFPSIEAKLIGANLEQFTAGAQPAQWQRRILACGHHESEPARSMLDEVRQCRVNVGVGYHVIVLDDEDQVVIELGQVVEHQWQDDVEEIGGRSVQRGRGATGELRRDTAHRRAQVGDEARGVVVGLVQ